MHRASSIERSRWWGIPVLFLLAAAGGRLTWLALAEPRLTLVSPPEFQDVLVGTTSDALITVRNAHPWKTLRVSGVRSSCGCVYLDDRPLTVPPRSNIDIPITLKLDAYEESSTSTLYFNRGDDDSSALRLGLTVNALAPFRGWPEGAAARRLGGDLVIEFDRSYAPHIVSAEAAPIGGELQTIDVDPFAGVMKIPSDIADADSLELLLAFSGSGELRLWNGYMTVEPGAKAPAESASQTAHPRVRSRTQPNDKENLH